MSNNSLEPISNVALPWSDGSMSAKMWQKGSGVMVSVPELDLCCYGRSQSEAVLRLFTNLLKYHNELKALQNLSSRQETHFELLKVWIKSVENKMRAGEPVLTLAGRGGRSSF